MQATDPTGMLFRLHIPMTSMVRSHGVSSSGVEANKVDFFGTRAPDGDNNNKPSGALSPGLTAR